MPYPVSQSQCYQVKQKDESLANLWEVNVEDIAENKGEDDWNVGPEEKLSLRFEPSSYKAHQCLPISFSILSAAL